jgi:hypothetical protein
VPVRRYLGVDLSEKNVQMLKATFKDPRMSFVQDGSPPSHFATGWVGAPFLRVSDDPHEPHPTSLHPRREFLDRQLCN